MPNLSKCICMKQTLYLINNQYLSGNYGIIHIKSTGELKQMILLWMEEMFEMMSSYVAGFIDYPAVIPSPPVRAASEDRAAGIWWMERRGYAGFPAPAIRCTHKKIKLPAVAVHQLVFIQPQWN